MSEIKTPYQFVSDKFKVPQGATYSEPKITILQASLMISEYMKLLNESK